MKILVQKWGNSLAIRIPKSLADDIRVRQGAAMDLTFQKGLLVLKPVKAAVYSLKQFLKEVNSKNIHREYGIGKKSGKEIW